MSTKIENIIFDLGGVIINLEMGHSFESFSKLFGKKVEAHLLEDINHEFFNLFEKGDISEDDFRTSIRRMTHNELSIEDIDTAWNAMLKDIPAERIAWIERLTKSYNVVVLSNTNSIHIRRFNEIFKNSTSYNYPEELFDKLYYSYLIRARKPETASFQHVLDDFGMDPAVTVLFDDNLHNLNAAKQLGIQTVYVERNQLKEEQLPNGRHQ